MVKKKENGMPVRNDDKHKLLFRVPANDEGRKFVEDFREYINKGVYKLRVLYTGKRPKGTPHATTLKENADSIRGYVDIDCERQSYCDELNDRISAFAKEKSELRTIIGQQMAENKLLKEDLEALNIELGNCTKDTSYVYASERDSLRGENRLLHKELEEQAKKIDDSPSYNRLKVENRKLSVYTDSLTKSYAEIRQQLTAKENELKLEITGHTMMREERDKLKEERDELDKLCMSQQVEIDRLDTKIDNEVCEGSCVSQEDYDEALELKASMREEMKALNKSLAEAYESVSDLRHIVRDVKEERDDALDISRDLRIQLETTKDKESVTEDDVVYWMKIGYMLYDSLGGINEKKL